MLTKKINLPLKIDFLFVILNDSKLLLLNIPSYKKMYVSIPKGIKISKKGNETLRSSLYHSAWYIWMQAMKGLGDKIFVDLVKRLSAKKKHYYQILCAIAHKLLGIIFALLKKRQKFQQNYHFLLTSV